MEEGRNVTFDATSSSDDQQSDSELRFSWDFDGDGRYETSGDGLTKIAHAYNEPGEYSVRLQVTDERGLSDTYGPVKITVTESSAPPRDRKVYLPIIKN